MRNLLFCLIFGLPLTLLAQKPSIDSLKMMIQGRFSKVEGEFAVAFKDLQTGKTLFINENTSFHAASTMKTTIMVELFKQAKAGKFKLSDSVLVRNEFKSIVDGSAFSVDGKDDSDNEMYQQIGHKMTIYDLTYHMITRSSNLATDILIELVDAKNIMITMRDLGAKNIQILRGVEDGKAFKLSMNNTVTAFDLMLIFEKIAQKKMVDKASSETMIKILLDQKFNETIPALLPKDVKVAHKTGWITGTQHDSGIIFLPDGRQYILVLLSRKVTKQEEGLKALNDVSKIIYDFVK